MRCPYCGHLEDKVVDSRQAKDGMSIRRRRECQECSSRFTSYERIEESLPQIVKKDGVREDYDRDKLRRGVKIACNKLPVSASDVEAVVSAVERKLIEKNVREVDARTVGEAVMAELRDLDPVAYIRFASVYREFGDIQEFLRELRDLDDVSDAED
jgi:transcriptional repressor NrdR